MIETLLKFVMLHYGIFLQYAIVLCRKRYIW